VGCGSGGDARSYVSFSEKHIFGETPLRERLPFAGIVFLEYALSCVALAADSRLAFAGGFVLASAAIMTLASGAGGVIIGIFSMWGWGHCTPARYGPYRFWDAHFSPTSYFWVPVFSTREPSGRESAAKASF
jgi:hypothetical protein